MRVFWSWQADTPGNIGRFFVRDTLAEAIKALKADEEIIEPSEREARDAMHLDSDRRPASTDAVPAGFIAFAEDLPDDVARTLVVFDCSHIHLHFLRPDVIARPYGDEASETISPRGHTGQHGSVCEWSGQPVDPLRRPRLEPMTKGRQGSGWRWRRIHNP